MAKRIRLKFGMEAVLPRGIFTEKIVQFRLGIIELQMRENGIYLVPVQYTLVSRAPDLAARPTIVCLDTLVMLCYSSNALLFKSNEPITYYWP